MLIVVGLVLYLITLLPISGTIKQIIQVLVIIVAILYLAHLVDWVKM